MIRKGSFWVVGKFEIYKIKEDFFYKNIYIETTIRNFFYFTSNNLTLKNNVAFPGISGGEPRLPYLWE